MEILALKRITLYICVRNLNNMKTETVNEILSVLLIITLVLITCYIETI